MKNSMTAVPSSLFTLHSSFFILHLSREPVAIMRNIGSLRVLMVLTRNPAPMNDWVPNPTDANDICAHILEAHASTAFRHSGILEAFLSGQRGSGGVSGPDGSLLDGPAARTDS